MQESHTARGIVARRGTDGTVAVLVALVTQGPVTALIMFGVIVALVAILLFLVVLFLISAIFQSLNSNFLTAGNFPYNVYNNMIVNNVAGYSGGGISLQDTARSTIVNNTVMNNDSTSTVGTTFTAGPNTSGVSAAACADSAIGITQGMTTSPRRTRLPPNLRFRSNAQGTPIR